MTLYLILATFVIFTVSLIYKEETAQKSTRTIFCLIYIAAVVPKAAREKLIEVCFAGAILHGPTFTLCLLACNSQVNLLWDVHVRHPPAALE